MTVGELITMINLDTNEILDDSTEYIPYINAAIDYLTMALIPMKDKEVVRSMDVTNNYPVPGDFTAFVPAVGYPIRIVNGSFQTYGGKTVNDVFYAVKKPHVSNEMDSIMQSRQLPEAITCKAQGKIRRAAALHQRHTNPAAAAEPAGGGGLF